MYCNLRLWVGPAVKCRRVNYTRPHSVLCEKNSLTLRTICLETTNYHVYHWNLGDTNIQYK